MNISFIQLFLWSLNQVSTFDFSYEPELHPGVTYRCKDPKATLKIFSTGSITITAPSVTNVQRAVEHIYPLVEVFKKSKTPADRKEPIPKILEKYELYLTRSYVCNCSMCVEERHPKCKLF